MIRKRNKSDLEEFKYLIDSRNLTHGEKKQEREAILEAREERFSKRAESEIKAAKLLRLKYQMEEYLSEPKCKLEPSFPKFLSLYIDTLYEKRKNFASDINIAPITLSHVINKHREPKASFLYKLILHSQDSFKEICDFKRELWPKVFYQDKVCHFLTLSAEWGNAEKKNVKGKVIKVPQK